MNMHVRPPRALSRAMRPLRVTIPVSPGASPRAVLEAQVAFLIDVLDRIDGDTDLEHNGDLEPSLGAHSPGNAYDAEHDPAETEPSLGSLDGAIDQERWSECTAFFGGVDRELDDCDDEHGHDAEDNNWGNPLGARVDGRCNLIVERVPARRVRRPEVRS